MKNDDKRHAIVSGHLLEKRFDGFQPACRCANSNHGKLEAAGYQLLALGGIGGLLGDRLHAHGLINGSKILAGI